MNSAISIVVIALVLCTLSGVYASVGAADFFQEGELQRGPFPNGSSLFVNGLTGSGVQNRVSDAAASASASSYQLYDPFQISNCHACRERCTAFGTYRYDCQHQNGLVVQCCCDGTQIWPTTCEQCVVGCPGYSTCEPGPNAQLRCTCSSAVALKQLSLTASAMAALLATLYRKLL